MLEHIFRDNYVSFGGNIIGHMLWEVELNCGNSYIINKKMKTHWTAKKACNVSMKQSPKDLNTSQKVRKN